MDKKKPRFIYQTGARKTDIRRLGTKWRKPRGRHSKLRQHKGGHPAIPSVGYGSDKRKKYKHPTGLYDILIRSIRELDNIDPKKQAARLQGSMGAKKRAVAIARADKLGIKVLNR